MAILVIQACKEETKFCITLNTTSENTVTDLNQDISVLKMRLNKICESCIVTGSEDLKSIQVCSKGSEKDLLSKTLLTSHGKVEFLETFENTDLFPKIESVDVFLATTAFAQTADSQFRKTTNAAGKEFDEFAKGHPLFVFLTPAVNRDENGTATLLKGPVIGYCKAIDTSLVMQMLSDPNAKALLPRNIRLLWAEKPVDKEGVFYALIALNENPPRKKLLNKNIKKAYVHKSKQTDAWEIFMNFDEDGSWIWRDMTGANIGKSIAICIDGKVFSYPRVEGEIKLGSSVISGDFDRNEADRISSILSSGVLVSELEIKN